MNIPLTGKKLMSKMKILDYSITISWADLKGGTAFPKMSFDRCLEIGVLQ